VVRESCGCVQGKEEEILDDDGGARYEGCGEGRVLLQAGPGEIDIEKEEEDSQANN
jgi:hypothetical protein